MERDEFVETTEDLAFEYDEVDYNLTTEQKGGQVMTAEVEVTNDDFAAELPAAHELSFNPEVGEFADVAKHGIIEIAGDDKYGDKIITFSACRFPPASECDHRRVFQYFLFTLDKYVDSDYVIVYFHFGVERRNLPSLRFLMRAYRSLGRSYKKNIKALFVVHPSGLVNWIIASFRKLVNSKFAQKVHRISKIAEMDSFLAIDRLKIPHEVKMHDSRLDSRASHDPQPQPPLAQFGVSLQFIYDQHHCSCPPVVLQCVDYIKKFGLDHEGIFRRSANKLLLDDICSNINQGIPVNFGEVGNIDLASVVLKRFFGLLEPALFPESFHDLIVKFHGEEDKLSSAHEILKKLPEINRELLFVLLDLLDMVQRRSAVNLMTSSNLGIVFGCNLCRPQDGLSSLFYLNNFSTFLIDNYHDLMDF